MTLANMRVNGVRAVIASCESCGRAADVNVDSLAETTPDAAVAVQPAIALPYRPALGNGVNSGFHSLSRPHLIAYDRGEARRSRLAEFLQCVAAVLCVARDPFARKDLFGGQINRELRRVDFALTAGIRESAKFPVPAVFPSKELRGARDPDPPPEPPEEQALAVHEQSGRGRRRTNRKGAGERPERLGVSFVAPAAEAVRPSAD